MTISRVGSRQPFVVWWQPNPGRRVGVRDILGCHGYAVLEFDS